MPRNGGPSGENMLLIWELSLFTCEAEDIQIPVNSERSQITQLILRVNLGSVEAV